VLPLSACTEIKQVVELILERQESVNLIDWGDTCVDWIERERERVEEVSFVVCCVSHILVWHVKMLSWNGRQGTLLM